MKKTIFIFTLLHYVLLGKAQQVFSIKEYFDCKLEPHYTSGVYDFTNPTYFNGAMQSWGNILRAYLKMYEVTKDKAYLNKFIKHTYNLQQLRDIHPSHNLPIPSPKKIWHITDPVTGNDENEFEFLYGGLILGSMGEYIKLVNSDPELYNTNLLAGLIPSSFPGYPYTFLGYGDFANFLQARIIESLNYFISAYWFEQDGCFKSEPTNSNDCFVINYHSAVAGALFFIGNVDPINHADYTHKAEQIVTFFRNRVTEFPPNQSYTWFHNEAQTLREDVSHGAIDIHIPIVAYKLYGSGLYLPGEMNKFAHTFTNNIWDRFNRDYALENQSFVFQAVSNA
jgi:hypothetical protein